MCNEKHSSKVGLTTSKDLTLQDINMTLIELQQSWVAAVDSCFTLGFLELITTAKGCTGSQVLDRRASETLSSEENYPPWKVWQLKKVCD